MCPSTKNSYIVRSNSIKRPVKSIISNLSAPFLALTLSACAVTPDSIEEAELFQRVETNLAKMYADQEPLSGSVDLYQAVARGLKYNLDKRLKMMERSLEEARLAQTTVGMLPQIAAKRRLPQTRQASPHQAA